MTPEDVKAYAVAMRENGVLRLCAEEANETQSEFTMELHPSVFGALAVTAPGDTAAALEAASEATKCACGHDRAAEHHNGLCIAGACDPAVCNPGGKAAGA